jgi:hypothetical protein
MSRACLEASAVPLLLELLSWHSHNSGARANVCMLGIGFIPSTSTISTYLKLYVSNFLCSRFLHDGTDCPSLQHCTLTDHLPYHFHHHRDSTAEHTSPLPSPAPQFARCGPVTMDLFPELDPVQMDDEYLSYFRAINFMPLRFKKLTKS